MKDKPLFISRDGIIIYVTAVDELLRGEGSARKNPCNLLLTNELQGFVKYSRRGSNPGHPD